MPFLTNWNGTGTTQKHNYWDLQSDTAFVLRYDFDAISSSPSLLKATFLPTSTAMIKNYLTEVSNTTMGNVGIIDPWYYYEDEGGQWIQDGEPNFYSSPIDIQNNSIDSYGGVFLNQNPQFQVGLPYYSVKVDQYQDIPLTQTGKTHRFYFQKWEANPTNSVTFQNSNALETPAVFTLGGATAQANLKGTGLSSNIDTYTNNGQSKTIRTPDGSNTLHRVYESLGHVWYETSTDNGQSWILMNSGHPLDNGGGKSPSMIML